MAYPISSEILKLFLSQYRQVIRITVAGQTETFELTENDIAQNGFGVSRYCVSGSTLELGSAISSEVDIILNNKDGRFNATSFEGAEMYVEVGIKKWDARRWENAILHYVPIGYFTVDNSPRKSQTITIAALDRMMQFAKTVVREKLVFPTTVGTLLRAICGECGITLATDISTLPNINQNIPECPEDEDLTYRTLLQWIAQLTGTCAYIDWEGKLRLEWYKTSNPVRLTPATRYTPSDLAECDIVITGVELITDEDTTYLCGEDTYTLVIEGNELVQENHEEILRNIYNAVGNLAYRPYSCNTKPLPHLFPMDMVEWEDAEGNVINTILTNYSFSLNCSTALEAKGETETDLSYASADPLTAQEKTVINRMRKDVSREITSRQQAVLDLNETIANSLGLYETRVELKDKSILCYYHDKPTLAESTAIYTRNANGYAWTVGEGCWNDGNPTWQYGYTKEGNAVYNAISAFKIQTDLLDAECITAEKIKVGAIGGFDIDEHHIGHGKTAYDDAKDGVFLSPQGIGLGAGKFYVTAAGYLHAESGEFAGDIKGGTININDNFKVDSAGNVTLNGNITWGTGASPTQVVYAKTAIAKPNDDTSWSSFPATSSDSWHRTYSSYADYYASYTYDGGHTWTDPIKIKGTDGSDGSDGNDGSDGSDGDTIKVVYLYYRKTSSSAPSKPSYDGTSLPSGWSLTPTGVTSYYLYEFVSQCTVTNGIYGTWSTPVIWAKYGVNGSDGSDASVTDQNVFNALTSNGTMYGCFTALNGKLYINAAYINAGTLSSDYTFTGKLVAENADITGTVYATAGELENLTITGKLYFGGDTQYYINANYNDGSYYINLPGFRVDDASGAVFSGKLSGATGTFSGALSAATGSFSGSITSTSAVITGGRIEIGEVITVKEDGTVKIKSSAGNGNGILNIDNYWIELQSGVSNLEMTSTHLRIEDNSYVGSQGRNILNWVELWGGKVSMYRDGVYFTIYIDGSPKAVCPHNLYITGNWTGSSSGSISSDANKKNTIENMEEAYDVLFDNLKPRTFKYNNGTSDRLHTGYIAQEVKSAMDLAGIDAKNFAALCIDRPNTEHEEWSLRYEEFVSINTWQIQKLKQRVAELEALIKI